MLTFAGVLRFAAPKKLRIDKIIDETGVFLYGKQNKYVKLR